MNDSEMCLISIFSLLNLNERTIGIFIGEKLQGMRNNAYKCRGLVCHNAIILNYDSVTRSRRSRGSKLPFPRIARERTIFFVDLVNVHDLPSRLTLISTDQSISMIRHAKFTRFECASMIRHWIVNRLTS